MASLERDEFFKELTTILNDLLEDWEYSDEINMETSMVNDLEFESIDAVALGEALETHYQQSLPFTEFLTELGEKGIKDFFVSDLVEFLYQNVERKA